MTDPATAYTHRFVRESLAAGARRLLEVGCGDGALAASLQADGFDVVAIDADPSRVAAARTRGVHAHCAEWPGFDGGTFDAVLFTRSLHHIGPLPEAVSAALACLSAHGRLIVEDFDAALADEPTFTWFASLIRLLANAGIHLDGDELLAALMTAGESPAAIWHRSHHHDLHSAEAIDASLRGAASAVTDEGAAYFFRYVARAIPEAEPLVEALREHEEALIGSAAIRPLGRRWVAAV